MATTRFYLANSAAPVAATSFDSGWEQTAGVTQALLATAKTGANTSGGVAETTATTSFDVLVGQFISAPFERAGSIPAQTITLTVARLESDAAADFTTRFAVRVLNNAGTTQRGSAGGFLQGTEWPTAATAIAMAATISAITVHKGDRLVIEYGYRTGNAVTTSYTGTMRYGGTDSIDLANADTGADATTRSPWVDIDVSDLLQPVTTIMRDTVDGYLSVQVAWGADLSAADTTWAWSDITGDVRMADQIHLRHGRSDEASTTQPASCQLTLDNQAGAYSLGGQSSNWPYVRQGTPVRVRVDSDGTGWTTLFQGGAVSWQPAWDVTGSDATVVLTAAGDLRRLQQGDTPVKSPLHRYYSDGAGADSTLLAYWPCEDGSSSTTIASGLTGGAPMTISGDAEYPFPQFAANSDFVGSSALPEINYTAWRGAVPTYTNTTDEVQVSWMMRVPVDGASGTQATLLSIHMATGTLVRWDIDYVVGGLIKVYSVASSGVRTEESNVDYSADDTVRLWSLALTYSAPNMSVELAALGQGRVVGGTFVDTVSGQSTVVSRVTVCPAADLSDTVIGHIAVRSDRLTSLFAEHEPLKAHSGEIPSTRISRLCSENGVAVTVTGTSVARCGAQSVAPLLALLREAETVDQGILYDGVSAGLAYIAGPSRINAAAAITLDASLGQPAREIGPVDNDQHLVNRATVTRTGGAAATVEDSTGVHGTAAVGTYDTSYTVNCESDTSATDYAGWAVRRGTVEGYRYPRAQLDLARNPELVTAWLGTQLADRVDITNITSVRSQHPAGTVSTVLEGYTQTLDQFRWDVELNLSPYEPWRVGLYASTTGDTGENVARLETDGSTLAAGASQGATSLSVATATGPLWTTDSDDFPLYAQVGGIKVTVTAISGASSPQTFTVTGSTVTKALTSGSMVELWQPAVMGV